jgi:3-oxoacyl-[acyl-carrier-protein] synthase-3
MNGAKILSVAAQRPAAIMTNDQMIGDMDTDDAWIQARTGIRTRGVANDEETLIELSAGAASKAIAASGIDPKSIDLTIVATSSNPIVTPGIAPPLTGKLGLTSGAFDVMAACAGFCYSLNIAADAVRTGSAKNVLLVGAERITDRMDPTDRNTAFLFGDGAGAAIISATEIADDGIGPVVWGSDGALANYIHVPVGEKYLHMDGQGVFKWAITKVADIAREACERAGIAPSELTAFVPHQANLRIIEAVARNLKLGEDTVVADDVRYAGNTSAASVPMALTRLKEEGRVQPGDPTLLIGFGSGMTWASQVIRCP